MKKRMIGIILMSLGGLLLIAGAMLFKTSGQRKSLESNEIDKIIEVAIADGVLTNNERNKIREIANKNNIDADKVIQQTEERLNKLNIDSETELVDYKKKNGLDFEKYIVQKFNKQYFKIKHWAGDKYVNGHYAETTPQPDILFEFNLKGETTAFALECKWRKQLYKNGVEFASKEQFDRYNNFEKTKKIPVFIAIGIGGTGGSPENVYLIPLREIKSNFIYFVDLKKYEKEKNTNFYFNTGTLTLK
ncbi:hypothetical protein FC093_19235 [Ilyomonas limi]|uniref:Uncharacterized protein n=1 Tax=Ilyomonas limi TaxID=2575867 RepID=A0A4U3KTM2_9BACT|nr:hypothetical protein [Ilyomonas limi]TKK65672.1 hypothetical protein FC093_19235 [Ilyomonas limi]